MSLNDPPVAPSPAPWSTKCETYWLFTWLPAVLPEGIYDPLEAQFPHFTSPDRGGKFKGGLGMIQIVRYSETPVGPYDELLIIPGEYEVPGKNINRKRISRIYVSQRETCYNGRINWNIPKHLARFTFSSPPASTPTSSPPHSLHIAVYPPFSAPPTSSSSSRNTSTITDATPFFTTTLTPMRLLPSFPLSTTHLPPWGPLNPTVVQPPLPSAPPRPPSSPPPPPPPPPPANATPLNDAPADHPLLARTTTWKSFAVRVRRARARGMWVDVHAAREGSEEAAWARRWWPGDVRPFRVGLWLQGAVVEFPAAEEWVGE